MLLMIRYFDDHPCVLLELRKGRKVQLDGTGGPQHNGNHGSSRKLFKCLVALKGESWFSLASCARGTNFRE